MYVFFLRKFSTLYSLIWACTIIVFRHFHSVQTLFRPVRLLKREFSVETTSYLLLEKKISSQSKHQDIMEQASNNSFSKKYKKYNLHDKEKLGKICTLFPSVLLLCSVLLLVYLDLATLYYYLIWNLRVANFVFHVLVWNMASLILTFQTISR